MATTTATETGRTGERQVDNKERLTFAQLRPEVARTMEMTRHLIIGVGGVGKEALLAMGFGMRERDMKFGVPDIERKVVVDAIAIDSDSGTHDREKSEDARNLKASGVNSAHLYVSDQNGAFRRAGILDKVTPGMPSSADTRGCNAIPKVGLARYALVRNGAAKDTKGNYTNPRVAVADMASAWKEPGQPLMKRDIYVDVLGGQAGGTGPAASAIVADTITSLKELYGTDHDVTVRLWAMSGEGFGLDSAVPSDGKQRDRDYNSLVSALYLLKQSFDGGVTLPDGTFLEGTPGEIFVLDGQSSSMKVPKRGAYQPIYIAAKALLTQITGEANSKDASAMSNIGSDQKLLEIPIPGDEFNPTAKRFSAIGACETLSNPQPVVLEREKRKHLFERAVGITPVTGEQMERIMTLLGKIFPPDVVKRLQDGVESPELREDQIITKGSEADAGTKVESVSRNFRTQQVAALRGLVEALVTALKDKSIGRLGETRDSLRKEEGLMTENAMLAELEKALDTLVKECNSQKTLLGNRIRQDLTPPLAGLEADVKNNSDIPSGIKGLFGAKEKAIRNLREKVTTLVTHLNAMSVANRDYRVYELLLSDFVPALREAIDAAKQQSTQQVAEATAAFEGIKEAYDPNKTGATQFDYQIPVQPSWKEDPATMRRDKLNEFTPAEYAALIGSIELKADDTDLLSQFDENMARAMGAWAQPMTRQSAFWVDTGDKPKGRIPIFAVPSEYVEMSDEDGTVTGTRGIPVPDGFQVTAVKGSNRVLAMQQTHGVAINEREYMVSTYRNFLGLKPAEREKYFTIKGDMEAILLPFARAMADAELARDSRGSIQECTGAGCKIAFYRPMRNTQECCPGCSKK